MVPKGVNFWPESKNGQIVLSHFQDIGSGKFLDISWDVKGINSGWEITGRGDEGMSTWNFAGDALKVNFCPECGSLLDLPNQIGNIECKLCNFICAAQGTFPSAHDVSAGPTHQRSSPTHRYQEPTSANKKPTKSGEIRAIKEGGSSWSPSEGAGDLLDILLITHWSNDVL